MLAFILRRVMQSVVVLFVMSLIVFSMINLVGDPVDMLVNPESHPKKSTACAVTSASINRPMCNTGSF